MVMILFSYFVGAIPTGYIISKYVYGIDIQSKGSGNIGATNMTRILGKKVGALTLAIDLLKSFFMIGWVIWAGQSPNILALSCVALLLGNCFSVFLKGKGGKGVATSFGIYLALSPTLFFMGVLVYGLSLKLTKISAVGSLAVMTVWPLAAFFIFDTKILIYMSFVLSALGILRHRKNILAFYKKKPIFK